MFFFRFIFAAFYETTTAGRSYNEAPATVYNYEQGYDYNSRVKRRVEVGENEAAAASEAVIGNGNGWGQILSKALVGKRLSRALRSFADAAESFDR